MFRNMSEKFRAKFPSTTLGYFCLDDAFVGILELEASPLVGQQLQQKDKKRRRRKGEKILKKTHKKPEDIRHFLV